MKTSLQFRQSQHLALTPQLQQSIRLLQLSTLELQQELEQALHDNPMLERIDDPLTNAVAINADGLMYPPLPSIPMETHGEFSNPSTQDSSPTQHTLDSALDSSFDSSSENFPEISADYGRPQNDIEDDTRPQLGAQEKTLREHLLDQWRLEKFGLREGILIVLMIESLDEDGYLHASEEELLELAKSAGVHDVRPEELEEARCLLQDFDPPGIAARSIAESLDLQLATANVLTQEVEPSILACARTLCREGLTLLAQRDFTRLKKITGADEVTLRAAHALIKRLNPYPGVAFARVETNYIVPDVIVRRVKNEWVATLNPEVLPKLRVNEAYAKALKSVRHEATTKIAVDVDGNTLTSRLQEARWLIKNVQQRFDTILRVAQAVVERQRAFFSHGAVAMRPLVLREIADILGLHESTVSRVTTQKYVLTPLGTFELKYFFGSHVTTEAGGAASSTAIRAVIKQLIGDENRQEPLSDSRLAEILGEQGIVVARRTVAKYREALRIPPVNQRKTL